MHAAVTASNTSNPVFASKPPPELEDPEPVLVFVDV
jgi:hypothetical protein